MEEQKAKRQLGLSARSRASRIATGRDRRSPTEFVFILLSVLISLVVATNDPFGLSVRGKVALQSAFDRAFAARYQSGGVHRIALIEPSAEDVASGRLHHPISYTELAAIVDLANAAHARAVFLDYQFVLPANGGDLLQLTNAVRDAHGGGLIVFTGPIGDQPSLAPLKAVVQQVRVSQRVDHPTDYKLDGSQSPAGALYEALCSASQGDGSDGCNGRLLTSLRSGRPLPDLAMQMEANLPLEQRRYMRPQDFAACGDSSFLKALEGGLAGPGPADPCPHFLTLPAGAAVNPDYATALEGDLAGRVIIVGPGLDLGDDHDWPGVGRLPGGLFHATALDNLLTWGNHYRRWPPTIPIPLLRGRLGVDDALGVLLVFGTPALALWAIKCVRRGDHQASKRVRKGRAWAGLAFWFVGAVLPGFCAIAFLFLNWAPACALTALAIGLPLCTAICGDELAKSLKPLDGRTAAFNLGLALSAVLVLLAVPAPANLWWACGLLLVLFANLSIGVSKVARRLLPRLTRSPWICWLRQRLRVRPPAEEPVK